MRDSRGVNTVHTLTVKMTATNRSFAATMLTKIWITLFLCIQLIEAQGQPTVLTPPYFNLAYQRRITATATCGVGHVTEEQYCKLTGADPTGDFKDDGDVIDGQLCDVCMSEERASDLGRQYPGRAEYYARRVHAAENAVDGTEKWWQSPPLSRGLQYNEVNVTVDLGQVSWLCAD